MNILQAYLTPNKYSRPKTRIKKTKGIVIHWFANPGTTARANRDFFESRKNGSKGYGSANELICLTGDVVLAIPAGEMAYGAGSSKPYMKDAIERLSSYPNDCTYHIECAHIDWNGKMTEPTYHSLVERCAYWCKEFGLDPLKDLWLHKEIVGWKDCHKWFVDNPVQWTIFKAKVHDKMNRKVNKLDKEIANGIIAYLKVAYGNAKTAEEKKKIGEYADELRVLSGQAPQNK